MQQKSLSSFLLTMIIMATVLSIKNWPITAELGFSSLFFLALAAIVFFIPVSLVSAELATGWPKKGGVFVWVKEALGHRWGFLAVWLLWAENVVWYPTILSFIAGTLAYLIDPKLAESGAYMCSVIVGGFWLLTLLNLRGVVFSGWISTVGMIFGTLVPGTLIIALGFKWWLSGSAMHIDFSWNELVPDLTNPAQMAIFAGVILGLAGMEMPAVHANDVKNPKRSFPVALFTSAILIISLSILGTLAIAMVVPHESINLTSGSIEAISSYLQSFGMGWIIPIITVLVALGAVGGVSTWIAGPCRGLLAAAEAGDFPPILHKANRHGMPVNMLLTQACLVTILSLAFVIFPDINSSFWMLIALTSQLYLVMYGLLFLSGIVLRFKRPDVERAYRVPGGNLGMCIVGGLGLLSSIYCFGIGFYVPEQISMSTFVYFQIVLVVGLILFCGAPFLILKLKKPSWNLGEQEPGGE